MNSTLKAVLGAAFGLILFALIGTLGGDDAKAQNCGGCQPPPACNTACQPPAPPPNCCAPPTPPTPPQNPCCTPPGHNINVPSVNVWVNSAVVVNANVSATANVSANASGTGSGTGSGSGSGSGYSYGVGLGFGGGYGGGSPGPGFTPGVIGGIPDILVVEAVTKPRREKRRIAYDATRTRTTRVIIQAFCLDDRGSPHPASQVFPEKNVDDDYDGELYRCIAGTRMQYVYADYNDRVSFDGGKTITCEKDQALYHMRGGKLECRRQAPGRDCNERSLLRRFGAGIKIVVIVVTETYTAYREEEVESRESESYSYSDGVVVGGRSGSNSGSRVVREGSSSSSTAQVYQGGAGVQNYYNGY